MRCRRVHPLRLALLACTVLCASAGAQAARSRDSVRVLRFQPDSAASPVAPVVITFDRPVAPKLDESIAPDSLLSITPARPHRTYWRDPSTLVAEFGSPSTPGMVYDVRVAPALRGADGAPLARTPPWRVRVQMPRMLALLPVGEVYEQTFGQTRIVDPSARVMVVFSSDPRTLPLTTSGLSFVPDSSCANRDRVRLAVVAIRPIKPEDSYNLKEVGGYDRDRRLDSLRRVVELRAERPPPRGCAGTLPGLAAYYPSREGWPIRIAPLFGSTGFATIASDEEHHDCRGGRCEAGLLMPKFSHPVAPESLLAHVRIDGRPAHAADGRLYDTVHAGRRIRVSIDASLTSQYGERLGKSIDTVLSGWQSNPALGITNGQIVLARRAPYVLRIRYANTDSVRVIIARVADTLRSRVLQYVGREYDRIGWSRLVVDSVVRVVAAHADSVYEGVLDVPADWVPQRWGREALIAIRALPVKTPAQVGRPS